MERVIRRLLSAITAMTCIAVSAGIVRADVKIKTKSTQQSSTSEQTTYIKGQRQRIEMANGMMVSLTQCDLHRMLQISPQTKTYIVSPFAQTNDDRAGAGSQPQTRQNAQQNTQVKGGVITTTITNKDTGERKQILGYTARHIITTMTTESSPEACSKIKSRMEIDAWYIDAGFGLDCGANGGYQNYSYSDKNGCQDRSEVKQVGVATKGYPVWTKTSMFDESGKLSFSVEQEVIEISKETLDAALFDVPADYREVKNFSEVPAGVNNDAANGAGVRADENSGMSANVKNMADKQAGDARKEVGAKKAGVIRLGLAAVKVSSVGEGLNATELSAAIQNTLTQYLKSPNVETVLIEAKLPSQIDAEAKQKECDFVIYTNVAHKKGGSKFGSFAPALSGLASLGGVGGSTAGAVAGQVASTAIITAANVSANVKAKDQLTLDVQLQAPGSGVAALNRQFKAKAQSNGEDIISPTVEQAAQAIMDAARKPE